MSESFTCALPVQTHFEILFLLRIKALRLQVPAGFFLFRLLLDEFFDTFFTNQAARDLCTAGDRKARSVPGDVWDQRDS